MNVLKERLSFVINSDRVLVMEGGNIIATRHHRELKGNNDFYDLLFQSQYEVN